MMVLRHRGIYARNIPAQELVIAKRADQHDRRSARDSSRPSPPRGHEPNAQGIRRRFGGYFFTHMLLNRGTLGSLHQNTSQKGGVEFFLRVEFPRTRRASPPVGLEK